MQDDQAFAVLPQNMLMQLRLNKQRHLIRAMTIIADVPPACVIMIVEALTQLAMVVILGRPGGAVGHPPAGSGDDPRSKVGGEFVRVQA